MGDGVGWGEARWGDSSRAWPSQPASQWEIVWQRLDCLFVWTFKGPFLCCLAHLAAPKGPLTVDWYAKPTAVDSQVPNLKAVFSKFKGCLVSWVLFKKAFEFGKQQKARPKSHWIWESLCYIFNFRPSKQTTNSARCLFLQRVLFVFRPSKRFFKAWRSRNWNSNNSYKQSRTKEQTSKTNKSNKQADKR